MCKGFIPATPQNEAGRVIEPPVWVPIAPRHIPQATAAAEPLDEPPGVRSRFQGLRVTGGSIQASKAVAFSRVLFGLNIPDVGWVTAQNLARHFERVDRLLDASQEQIQEVDGIGPERAEAIAEWFSDDANRALVAELRELGLRFEIGEEDRPKEGPLTGKTYAITGTLERYSRDEAAAALEALGAKVANSVSAKTTGLVVGEDPGASKLTKAQKAEVPILSEADLLELLGESSD